MAILRRKRSPDGRMSLGDHLRELRRRIVIAASAILVGSVLGWFEYDSLFTQLMAPLRKLEVERGDHLRELRRRIVIAASAILVGSVLGWFEYDSLFTQLMAPLRKLEVERGGLVNI